jgi:hypothetical protein
MWPDNEIGPIFDPSEKSNYQFWPNNEILNPTGLVQKSNYQDNEALIEHLI